MNEFRTLRAQARRERDETIAHAKQRCKEALAQIAALKRTMKKPKKPLRPIRREPTGSNSLRQAMIELLGDRSMSARHHAAMTHLFVAWYNFCRKHESVRRATPAMAGVTDHVWSLKELLQEAAK
jgi:hypothetical protein